MDHAERDLLESFGAGCFTQAPWFSQLAVLDVHPLICVSTKGLTHPCRWLTPRIFCWFKPAFRAASILHVRGICAKGLESLKPTYFYQRVR